MSDPVAPTPLPRPEHWFRIVAKGKLRRRDIDAEVDVPDDARAVERAEPVGGDLVLQLLLAKRLRICPYLSHADIIPKTPLTVAAKADLFF